MTALAPNRPPFEPGLYITLFTDASYCPNTRAYGWCWWIKYGSPAKTQVGVGGGAHMQGSYQAEVEALRAGMAFIHESLPEEMKGKRIVIQSDCMGALEAIKPDLERLKRMGAQAAYTKHVKGHRGHATARNSVNTLCDRKAKQQMLVWRQKFHDAEAQRRLSLGEETMGMSRPTGASPRPRTRGF